VHSAEFGSSSFDAEDESLRLWTVCEGFRV
jgi:hypothetical protein